MRKFKLSLIFILIIAFTLFMVSCDWWEEVKDGVNETTKQTKSFDEELDNIPLSGDEGEKEGGYCSPAINFNDLLKNVSIWDDVKDHIDEIKINSLKYSVSSNKNNADITVNIYFVTDGNTYYNEDSQPPPDSELIGYTDVIPEGKNPSDEKVNFASGGKNKLEELITDFESSFSICAGWESDKEDLKIDMDLALDVDVEVTFVPLT